MTLIRLKMLTNLKECGLIEDREKDVYFALSLFRTLDIPCTCTFWHLFDWKCWYIWSMIECMFQEREKDDYLALSIFSTFDIPYVIKVWYIIPPGSFFTRGVMKFYPPGYFITWHFIRGGIIVATDVPGGYNIISPRITLWGDFFHASPALVVGANPLRSPTARHCPSYALLQTPRLRSSV